MKLHLKRYLVPKAWRILKKKQKFVIRPNPGGHRMEMSLPLNLALKQINAAKTTREVKKALNTQEVLVDGRRVKEHKLPVGLMDIITIKATGNNYRVTLDDLGYLKLIPIKDAEASTKLCRISSKTAVKKGKIQLGTLDGRSLLVDKNEHKVGDSILIELPSQKIKKALPFETGTTVMLLGSKNRGEVGTVTSIEGNNIKYETKQGVKETLKKCAFVVGKGKEEITIK